MGVLLSNEVVNTPVCEDNSPAITTATIENSRRMCQIDVPYHNMREEVKKKKIKLLKVTSGLQEADIAKSLPKPAHDVTVARLLK